MVFRLERPSPSQPYIKGLLDPCTNSLAAPNIPAEVLYDKQAGLRNMNYFSSTVWHQMPAFVHMHAASRPTTCKAEGA